MTATHSLAEHVPGTPDHYRHGWIPLATDQPEADKFGSASQFAAGARAQADDAYDAVAHASLFDDPESALRLPDGSPERSWGLYQVDGPYQVINARLRGKNVTAPDWMGSTDKLVSGMLAAFQDHNMTRVLPKPMKFYRGLADGPDVQFSVGDRFVDKGVISTSDTFDDVRGFIADHVPGSGKSTFLEIHADAGMRVLGGAWGGTEVMFPPGTRFEVKSVRTQKLKDLYADSTTNPDSGAPMVDQARTITRVVVRALTPEAK